MDEWNLKKNEKILVIYVFYKPVQDDWIVDYTITGLKED